MSDLTTVPITRPYDQLPWSRGVGIPEPIEHEASKFPDHKLLEVRPGVHLDRYLIEKEIGSGGMGVVYSALDTRLGRRVALKLVRSHTRSGKLIRRGTSRLLREAQALARISHPNIVALYDVGGGDYGVYMAMEYIEGCSLRHWLAGTPRRWKQVLAAFIQAGRGLSAAHQAGIVHRDFKPSNVHVGRDGRVAVLDFGLARAVPDGLPPAPPTEGSPLGSPLLDRRLTDVGVVLGTAGYMAPEQLFGRDCDGASDQFSFCVGLYEALYAQKPYAGETTVQLAMSYRNSQLRLPPDNRDAPAALFGILRRGLQVDPTLRYPSMDALLLDLNPAARQRPSAAGTA